MPSPFMFHEATWATIPRWLRESARMLSNLIQAADGELDDFLRERLRSRPGIEASHLGDMRALLLWLSRAIAEPSPERWRGVEHARRLLESWEDGMAREAEAPMASNSPSAAPPDSTQPVAAPTTPPAFPGGAPLPRHDRQPLAAPSPWMGKPTPPPLS
jgi:hypothetical protein